MIDKLASEFNYLFVELIVMKCFLNAGIQNSPENIFLKL